MTKVQIASRGHRRRKWKTVDQSRCMNLVKESQQTFLSCCYLFTQDSSGKDWMGHLRSYIHLDFTGIHRKGCTKIAFNTHREVSEFNFLQSTQKVEEAPKRQLWFYKAIDTQSKNLVIFFLSIIIMKLYGLLMQLTTPSIWKCLFA